VSGWELFETITRTEPGRLASDARSTVTLQVRGTPWLVKFHFLRLVDEETGELEARNVGFEIGDAFELGPAGEELSPGEYPPEIDPEAVRRIAAHYANYCEIARQQFVIDRVGTEAAIRRLRGPGKKPARLSDDFYRLILADYEAFEQGGVPPGRALAEKYHVHQGTASKWVKEARRRRALQEEARA
jgi:hypothetical protein